MSDSYSESVSGRGLPPDSLVEVPGSILSFVFPPSVQLSYVNWRSLRFLSMFGFVKLGEVADTCWLSLCSLLITDVSGFSVLGDCARTVRFSVALSPPTSYVRRLLAGFLDLVSMSRLERLGVVKSSMIALAFSAEVLVLSGAIVVSIWSLMV